MICIISLDDYNPSMDIYLERHKGKVFFKKRGFDDKMLEVLVKLLQQIEKICLPASGHISNHQYK
jgi:hypothetical protein